MLIEDIKEEGTTAYIKLKNENKENENADKNETNEVVETKTELKDRKTLFDLMNPSAEEKSDGSMIVY